MQIIANSTPGALSLWMTASKEGKIFRLLTSMEFKPAADLRECISSLSGVHIQEEKRYIPEALRPGELPQETATPGLAQLPRSTVHWAMFFAPNHYITLRKTMKTTVRVRMEKERAGAAICLADR